MWYLALRRDLQPRDTWTVSLDDHLAWMREQHERGSILLSGPSADRALGIYLIRANSRAAAEQIAAGDPFTAAGHCGFELIEWEVHQVLGVGPFSSAAFAASRAEASSGGGGRAASSPRGLPTTQPPTPRS
jgi:uncharacterized protein YciI